MATTLNNVDEDLKFYHELKKHIWGPKLSRTKDDHMVDMVKMGLLQIETLLECAISKVGNLPIDHQTGQDFIDQSDAKKVTSNYRNNVIVEGTWTNSYFVRNIKAKKGKLRVMAWNRYADKFEYFVIPHHAFQHLKCSFIEIVLDRYNGYYTNPPTPAGGSVNYCKWNAYKVKDFYELSTL